MGRTECDTLSKTNDGAAGDKRANHARGKGLEACGCDNEDGTDDNVHATAKCVRLSRSWKVGADDRTQGGNSKNRLLVPIWRGVASGLTIQGETKNPPTMAATV